MTIMPVKSYCHGSQIFFGFSINYKHIKGEVDSWLGSSCFLLKFQVFLSVEEDFQFKTKIKNKQKINDMTEESIICGTKWIWYYKYSL